MISFHLDHFDFIQARNILVLRQWIQEGTPGAVMLSHCGETAMGVTSSSFLFPHYPSQFQGGAGACGVEQRLLEQKLIMLWHLAHLLASGASSPSP